MIPAARRYWLLAAAVLLIVSGAALVLLTSATVIPSLLRNLLSDFVQPGVAVWWLVLGGPFRSAPSLLSGIVFAATSNAILWLLVLLLVVAVARILRRRFAYRHKRHAA
jgi:hypothetical protein